MERLFDTRVRIVTGKGGVGKSLVALSLAIVAARRGKRVLFLETNPPESVTRFLGKPKLDGEPRLVYENLWMAGLIPSEAIREYALMTLKFKALYNAVFENRIVRYFLRAVPSLSEFVLLGKLWFHEGERSGDAPKYDLIVVDAPATGHLISWLRVPHVFDEMMPTGPLKKSARDMLDMLLDPKRTKLDIVTVPEEMPVNEAIEIAHAAMQHRLATRGLTFINRILPPLPDALVATLHAGLAGADGATQKRFAALERTVATREHWRQLGEEYLQRLPAADLKRAIRLAKRAVPIADEAAVMALAAELEAQL
ncbi:MAG: ATPase [Deltaproteobacteria bacterium]|nr:ATPase [Deltaproteobacteria bacterium]